VQPVGIHGTDPVILNEGANVIVHLSPAPVVAKVAASTPAVRPDTAAWLSASSTSSGSWPTGRAPLAARIAQSGCLWLDSFQVLADVTGPGCNCSDDVLG
jgi:hypothetical protein